MRTCSLDCINKHKEKGCDGKAPVAKCVPISEMTVDTLLKDCKLYDRVETALSRVKERYENLPVAQKPNKVLKKLAKHCRERGITLKFMNRQSERAKENQTKIGKHSEIRWTVRWRFYRDDELVLDHLEDGVPEGIPMAQVLAKVVEDLPEVALRKILPLPDDCEMLLVAEDAEGDAFYEVDSKYGLSDNLGAKTVVEFPIIEVVSGAERSRRTIVNPFDVKQETESKQQETENNMPGEDHMPSYFEIEDALKRDIIESTVQDNSRVIRSSTSTSTQVCEE